MTTEASIRALFIEHGDTPSMAYTACVVQVLTWMQSHGAPGTRVLSGVCTDFLYEDRLEEAYLELGASNGRITISVRSGDK